MKNILTFYYNLSPYEVHNKDNYYFFNINNYYFKMVPFDDDPNKTSSIYELNSYLSSIANIDRIILNKYNKPFTIINGIPYILYLTTNNNNISLAMISNLSNINIENIEALERNNWEILWENKIDYFEMQVGENAKKYPLIRESFDYFVGMAENAISYLVNTKLEVKKMIFDKKVVSHITLNDSLYSPLNIILDHKARDIAEYIKISFFNNNYNIFKELDEYFFYNNYSLYGIRVLYARILYPSFYFNLYDDIVSGKKEEKEMNLIIDKVSDYQKYLYDIFIYLKGRYDIPEVEWIMKSKIMY